MNEYMKECLSKWREISLKISIIHPSLIILSFFLKVLVWLLPYSSLHRWLQRRNSWMSQLQQNYRHETKDLTDQRYWKLKINERTIQRTKMIQPTITSFYLQDLENLLRQWESFWKLLICTATFQIIPLRINRFVYMVKAWHKMQIITST